MAEDVKDDGMIVIGYVIDRLGAGGWRKLARTGEAVWRTRLIHCETFALKEVPAKLLANLRRLRARYGTAEHIRVRIVAAAKFQQAARAIIETAQLDGVDDCECVLPLANRYNHDVIGFAKAFKWNEQTSEYAREAAWLAKACAE